MNAVVSMATTSLSLGKHWETFIRAKVESGCYGSASEVVRDALRMLEKQDKRLEALQAHLAEGAAQADRGEFIDDFSLEKVVAKADRRE